MPINLSLWLGFASAAALIVLGVVQSGATGAILNTHGLIVVVGGTTAAIFINCPFSQLWSAFRRFVSLFFPSRMPSTEEAAAEIVRLARKAHQEGGLLSLQGDSREFADGFLHRAIMIAISAGETAEARRIIDTEIRKVRVSRNEDTNVFRTIGVLSPMFGLLGTLLGMIKVLETMSDPTKVGPAMALALSSAFFGISIANFLCVPIAGQLRLVSMQETSLMDLILEGVLDIAAGKSPYLVELHLAAYSQQRPEAAEGGVATPAAPTGAGAAP